MNAILAHHEKRKKKKTPKKEGRGKQREEKSDEDQKKNEARKTNERINKNSIRTCSKHGKAAGWCIEEFCEECDDIARAVVQVEANKLKKGKGIGSEKEELINKLEKIQLGANNKTKEMVTPAQKAKTGAETDRTSPNRWGKRTQT